VNRQQSLLAARGLTDANDQLLSADEPLAELHEACGGSLPGVLAVPELLDLVQQAREMGLRLAREFSAYDGVEQVSGFVRIHPLPLEEGGGCEVLVENWLRAPLPQDSSNALAEKMDAIDRAAAEISARLDARQQVQFVSATIADAAELQAAVAAEPGKVWSEYLDLQGVAHHQPLHWRLLDGALCGVPGSSRQWRARVIPIGPDNAVSPRGFELLLIADEPLVVAQDTADMEVDGAHSKLLGSALAPVLRQPIARIIANAETIRTRLAGPLRAEYSDYAGNIAAAGQHLSGMLDDLADLEVVEAPDFATTLEPVDIADAARRAAGILGVRAQDRAITVDCSKIQTSAIAMGDFRRVLQILINLVGNAIAYSPEGSRVWITLAEPSEGMVSVSVCDEGPGVSAEQATKIFEKFERLGRDSDGGKDNGSGLGLYISRKLALAMGGDLEVVISDGATKSGASHKTGAEFRLTLQAKP